MIQASYLTVYIFFNSQSLFDKQTLYCSCGLDREIKQMNLSHNYVQRQ